ncbi:hypothetical protein ILUMI_15766 [Ignelater luminosus]|uniref:Uncharacterized protein n=1 Tax=Ignelater luminosus TaxID=2038154 RepID=A0A8K0CU52_IGNLU|nr:hypothetical protein ILUMI_15766 [Ignelater luminosus]
MRDKNAKLTWWSPSAFTVQHCLGQKNELPDLLFRDLDDECQPNNASDTDEILPSTQSEPSSTNFIAAQTLADEVKDLLTKPSPEPGWQRGFIANYPIKTGFLYFSRKKMFYVPEEAINNKFGLSNKKIVSTVADNGSNFVTVFKEYGGEAINALLDEEYGSNECELEFLAFIGNDEIHLLNHKRCNTTNVVNWRKSAYPKSAEIIKTCLGHRLSSPGITRWNSVFDSLTQFFLKKRNYFDFAKNWT